ncbi:MAG TPA: YegP family protein [Wenzhouxiangella sp.]|nr:YegP family protein [Wenzhouxiangella sp.]
MAGWYVLKKSGDKFMFNLKAANGEVILTSQRYASRASAENGISSVQRNSPSDDRYERLESRAGQPYFTLKAENGQVIGTSQMYKTVGGRNNGIESVKNNGPSGDIREEF